MKKRLLSLLMTATMVLLLLPASAAEVDISGLYMATSCTNAGQATTCEGEYLYLGPEGYGVVNFNGTDYTITWQMDGDTVYFEDEEGYTLENGTYDNGTITGNYGGYDYVYEWIPMDASDGAAAVETPAADPETPTAETEEPAETGMKQVTYYADTCQKDGESYICSDEYFVANEDGTGMIVFDGCAYSMTWTYENETLCITDSKGYELTGAEDGDTITAMYRGYEYTYVWGDTAPVATYAPEQWGAGLPCVSDQADILSDEEEQSLTEKLQQTSQTYSCNVYVITVDDLRNFTLSNSVETLAEELRTGYGLGYGAEKNCILLLLSMEDRDYDICAFGDFGNTAFTDFAKERMADNFKPKFKNDNWYAGLVSYADDCALSLDMASKGKPMEWNTMPVNPILSGAVALVLGLIIAAVVCLILKAKMKDVHVGSQAAEYVAPNGLNFTHRSDVYSHTTTTRVYDPPTKSSSSGGTSTSSSGHSHSSGKF